METIALIPMEEEQKQQLKKAYFGPLYRNIVLLSLFMLAIPVVIIYKSLAGGDYALLLFLIPFVIVYLLFLHKLSQQKLHYYKDYRFGSIIKEQVFITRIFDTPSGINIYWLSSDAIKTFTPNPYRHFREGDLVTIYYLKHAKEYLAYEL